MAADNLSSAGAFARLEAVYTDTELAVEFVLLHELTTPTLRTRQKPLPSVRIRILENPPEQVPPIRLLKGHEPATRFTPALEHVHLDLVLGPGRRPSRLFHSAR